METKDTGVKNFKPQVLFNHRLEERKAIEYLINLINSPILRLKPFELFRFAGDILGQKKMVSLLVKMYPEAQKINIFDNHIIKSNPDNYVPRNTITSLLKSSILPLLHDRLKRLSSFKRNETEIRLAIIK